MATVSELLRQYGTSLEDTRELVKRLPKAFRDEEDKFKPTVLTSAMAKEQYGIDIEPDWMLRVMPTYTNERGFKLSLVLPDNSIIDEDNTLTTPEGLRYTQDDLAAMEIAEETGLSFQTPTSDVMPNVMAQDEDKQRALMEAVNMPQYEAPFTEADQILIQQQLQSELSQLSNIFKNVFLNQDVNSVLQYAETNPEEFSQQIIGAGRNEYTEALLRKMFPDITEDEIAQVFYQETPEDVSVQKVFTENYKDVDVATFSEWVKDNPDEFLTRLQKTGQNSDTEAFLKYLIPDISQEDIDYMFSDAANVEKINATVAEMDKMFALENVRAGKLDATAANDISRAIAALGIKFTTGSAVAEWRNVLTEDQKKQVISYYLADPNKKNAFASMVANVNQAAAGNLLIGLLTSPITASATPIAKKITGQEVSKMEWAVGAANLVLLALGPAGRALSAIGTAGKVITRTAMTGGFGIFTTDTIMKWPEMQTKDKVIAVAFNTLFAVGVLHSWTGGKVSTANTKKSIDAIVDKVDAAHKVEVKAALDDIVQGIVKKDEAAIKAAGERLQKAVADTPDNSVLAEQGKMIAEKPRELLKATEEKPTTEAIDNLEKATAENSKLLDETKVTELDQQMAQASEGTNTQQYKISNSVSFDAAGDLILREPNTTATQFFYGKEKPIGEIKNWYTYTTPKGAFKGRENKFIVNKWQKEDGTIRYLVHGLKEDGTPYEQVSSAVQFRLKNGSPEIMTIASSDKNIGLASELLNTLKREYGTYTVTEPISQQGAKLLARNKLSAPIKAEDSPNVANELRGLHDELQADVNIARKHISDIRTPDAQFSRLALHDAGGLISKAKTLIDRLDRGLQVTIEEAQALKDDLQSYKDYVKYTNKTTEQVKAQLTDYINKNLPLEERGKLLATLRDAKTDVDLNEAIARVEVLAEKSTQKRLISEIETAIEGTKPGKVNDIVQGKYTADLQDYFDAIRHNLHTDRAKALAQIEKNIDDYQKGLLDGDEMRRQNEILDMAGIDGMSSAELANVLDFVKTTKNLGKLLRLGKIAEDKAARSELAESVAGGEIRGGQNLKAGTGTLPAESIVKKTGVLERLENVQQSIWELGDKLTKLSGKPFKETKLYEFFRKNIYRPRQAEFEGRTQAMDEVKTKFTEIFGIKKQKDINQLFNNMSREVVDLGKFKVVDATGTRYIELKLTKGQLIKKYQEMLDPTLDKTFNEGMHWTYEIKSKIIDNLTPQEKAWAEFQMEYYQKYYDSINVVFREEYGINLPKNKNYSPINREFDVDVPEDMLVYKDLQRYSSVLNGSLKSRVTNINPLRFTDANKVFVNHILQMEHFKAWVKPMHELRSFMANKEVRQSIQQFHGTDILKQIELNLERIASKGKYEAQTVHALDVLRANFSRAVIGLKPYQLLQQMPTVFTGLTQQGTRSFFTGVADFWKNPVGNYKWLMENSSYIKDRYATGFERDIAAAMAKESYKGFMGGSNFKDKVYFLMTTGDKFGVMQSFWAKYKEGLSRGLTQVRALEEAGLAADRIQNTASLDTLSSIQTGGSFWKIVTMFQSQPNKYFRVISSNLRDIKYGRVNPAKGTANILLAWVVLPSIFQMIADGFQFKKERQLRAVALGPINDLFVIGQVSQTVTDWVMGENWDYQPTPIAAPIKDLSIAIQKARSLINKGEDPYKDITLDDVIALVESIAKPAGEGFGIPTPYLIQVEKAIRSGDPRQFVFSKWALEEPEADLKTKALDITNKIGQLRDPSANAPVDKVPEIEDMAKAFTDYKQIFSKTLPSDITEKNGYDPVSVAFAAALITKDNFDNLPGEPLYKIIERIENDDTLNYTIMQYYLDWQERSKIKSLAELVEFDKTHPRARYGNLTRTQLDLMLKYEALTTKAEKTKFLEAHPEMKEDPRDSWLKANPEENAKLALWGQAKVLTQQAYDMAKKMAEALDVPETAIESNLPPKELAKPYTDYQDAVTTYGANSAEAMLIRANNPKLEDYLGLDRTDKVIKTLEIQTKNRDLNDQYGGYADKDSKWYLPSVEDKNDPNYKTGREYAREQFKAQHPEWVDDQNFIEAYNKGADDSLAKLWVEHGQVANKNPGYDAEEKLWLIDHPEVFQWALDNELLTDEGKDWNEKVLRISAQYQEQDAEYDAIKNDDSKIQKQMRDAYLQENPEYAIARLDKEAYNLGLDEEWLDEWANYNQLPLTGYWRDWYRMENPDFDDAVKEVQATNKQSVWTDIDQNKTPTRAVYSLYEKYQQLSEGDERIYFRLQHKDLDNWLVTAKGYTPAKMPSNPLPKPKTTPTPTPTPKKTTTTRKPTGNAAIDKMEADYQAAQDALKRAGLR